MQAIKQLTTFVIAALCLGCSSQSTKTAEVQIKIDPRANDGRVFYMVAKPTSSADFFLDDYQKVAAESLYSEEKLEDLNTFVLIPGTTKTLQIPISQKDTPLAIYFLFTSPSESWKHYFDNPNQLKHKILIEESQIKAVSSF